MRYYWDLTPTELGKIGQQVKMAIRLGELIPKPCEVKNCNVAIGNVIAHHEDYNKPLDITWLCKSHHRKRHVQLNALRPKDYLINPRPKLALPDYPKDRIKIVPDNYEQQTKEQRKPFMAHFPDICYCKDCKLKRKEKAWSKI